MSGLKPDVPRVCPGWWCPCFGCAERRAAKGRPPLALRVGGRRIEALPIDEDGDGLNGARGIGRGLAISLGAWLAVVLVIAAMCS